MRCQQCNKVLTDEESCHKSPEGKYLDTCFQCLYDDFVDEDDGQYWDDDPELEDHV